MFQVFYAGGIQGMNAYKVRVEADGCFQWSAGI